MFQSLQQKFQIWRLSAQEKAEKKKCQLKRTINPPTDQDVLEGKSEGKITLKQPLTGYKAIVCETALPSLPASLFTVPKSNAKPDIFFAQITIPAGATVVRSRRYQFWPAISSSPSPKLRSDTQVIDKILTDQPFTKCYSRHDPTFTYEVGKTYKPDKLEFDLDEEHTAGLHFYIDHEVAKSES
jgi:hypothetical protein